MPRGAEAVLSRPAIWLAMACLTGALLPESWSGRISLQAAAVGAGEWWRLWTGHFSHYSPWHGMVNAAVILILASLLSRPFSTRGSAFWLLLALPGLSLAILAISPGQVEYRGASGIASALLLMVLVRQRRTAPRALAVLGALWLFKLGADIAGLSGPWNALPSGVVLSWQAHVSGIGIGLLTLAALRPVPPGAAPV